MSACGECRYYSIPTNEHNMPTIVSDTGNLETVDPGLKAACFYNPPYPNCGKTGRMTRPIVFYKEKSCSKFLPKE